MAIGRNDHMETPRDDTLSRIYRDLPAVEPSAALDAAILAEAGKAVAPIRRPLPAWKRWLAPAGVLATLTLTVSLSLLVQREQERTRHAEPAAAPAAAPAVTERRDDPAAAKPEARVLQGPKAEAGKPPPDKAAETSDARRSAPPARKEAAPEGAFAREPGPLLQRERKDALKGMLPKEEAAAPAAAPPVQSSTAEQAERGNAVGGVAQPAAAAPPAEKRAAPARLMDAAPARGAGKALPEAEQKAGSIAPARSIAQWLEDIRALRRAGRDSEAASELAAFRRTYPDFALPDDLK